MIEKDRYDSLFSDDDTFREHEMERMRKSDNDRAYKPIPKHIMQSDSTETSTSGLYLVYKLKNPHTNLCYIGVTKNLDNRIRQHKDYQTVDCQDFDVEILQSNISTIEQAFKLEKQYIIIHNTFENGYNKTDGGRYPTKFKNSKKKCDNLSI